MLNEIAIVASDTTRSRAYFQALVRNDLIPGYILIMEPEAKKVLPGQLDKSLPTSQIGAPQETDEIWSEARFDPALSIRDFLDKHNISYEVTKGKDINDPLVVEAVGNSNSSVFIYSGAGGAILREGILGTGKRFLHVHGGYIPEYKGSTTNYYSLLVEKTVGASSLFLVKEIDSGPVLLRQKFPAPMNPHAIDHIYDSGARAKVLIETLNNFLKDGAWNIELPASTGGETYYIIHPVLKHIAILDKSGEPKCE
jgi:methionyl-tRNA formyltransferase